MILHGRWQCPECHRFSTTITRPPAHRRPSRSGRPRKCRGGYQSVTAVIEVAL